MKMSNSDEVVDSTNSGSERNPSMKRSADSTSISKDDADEPKRKIVFGMKKPIGILAKKPDTFIRQTKKMPSNISIKLGSTQKAAAAPAPSLKPKVGKAALAFSQEEDEDEEEEMPPEAKMRMKNIGRDTPTSSGPNSFGKSRMGFCDSKKIYERKLKEIQDKLEEQ